mgnify:CR=1 FL=1
MQREQAGPVVTVNGQVVRRRVDWREGLSLAEALLEAEYTGTTTPVSLRITRGGRPISVTMRRFLSGSQNPILEPNDVIEVR